MVLIHVKCTLKINNSNEPQMHEYIPEFTERYLGIRYISPMKQHSIESIEQ